MDDNDLVGESLARCCDVPDISVIAVASNAIDALEAARQDAPDVVLMDYRLGRDNGVDVARSLLQLEPAAKVVIMTGDPSAQMLAEALDAGCIGCVGKTMHIASELPALIRRVQAGESL